TDSVASTNVNQLDSEKSALVEKVTNTSREDVARLAEGAGAMPLTPVVPPVDPTAEKKKSPKVPIYMEEANGKELIAAALVRARREHKHVLIEWGGNWCGWCFKLHDVFHKDPQVRPIVYEEFELVLIDERPNRELMLEYGGQDRKYSFPHLTILDWEGKILTNQETGSLEEGPNHSSKLVADFLNQWTPAKLDAEVVMADALKQAKADNKRVMVRVGDPYCGWCKTLSTFVHENETLLGKDYVDLKIDTLRMTHGKALAEKYLPKGCQGVPWMVFLDSNGGELANSMGPQGNIGCPSEPHEIEHFVKMLQGSKIRLTDQDIEALRSDLDLRREKRLAKTK
ncbi:MAG: thioredoxin family protein, partial [Pirellula sp.]